MKPSKMYLQKRPENGVWYFRRPIPKGLQAFVNFGNKREFVISLKTDKLPDARKAHHGLWMESERLLEEARQRQKAAGGENVFTESQRGNSGEKDSLKRRPVESFSRAELVTLAHRWFAGEWLAWMEKYQKRPALMNGAERKQEAEKLEAEIEALMTGDVFQEQRLAAQRREIIEEAGGLMTLRRSPSEWEAYADFSSLILEGMLAVRRLAVAFLRTGQPPAMEHLALRLAPMVKDTAKAAASVSLDALIDRFSKDPKRKGLKAKTRDEFAIVCRVLRELLGAETAIDAITREQMREIQELYMQLPAHAGTLYPGKTLRESVALAKRDGKPPMERATFNKRMTMISGLFKFAVKELLLAQSPADGLALESEAKTAGEKSFSVDELNLIFSGDVYKRFALLPESAFIVNHAERPHEYWSPLIALFEGMRMEEILQLVPDDITESDGVKCIRIREGEAQSLKTKQSVRTIPIHPELERLGFLRYVESVRQSGAVELFPDATRGKTYGNRSHNYSKRFNRYLWDVGVKQGRSQCFHSLRHTFTDAMREAEIPQDALRRLGGWTDKSSAETSYGGRLLPYLARHLEKVKYEGLNLADLPRPRIKTTVRAKLPQRD